ncbi:Pentatricopeptide repeat-containing protein [Nymphaea thermarum]|nr:Pentatricopeptide repeat-containing protein [Nymphaea thermarum]
MRSGTTLLQRAGKQLQLLHTDPRALALSVSSALDCQLPSLGQAAHATIIKCGHHSLFFLATHLINLYSKSDLQDDARAVLGLMPQRDVVPWTALIAGSVQNGRFAAALEHFREMQADGVLPNDFTLPCLIKASSSLGSTITGKQLHGYSIKVGLDTDVFVSCSIYDLYAKCGCLADACQLFDEIPHKSVVSWNALISGSVVNGRQEDAMWAFREIRRVGEYPNSITFCGFLNACSDASAPLQGMQAHGYAVKVGFDRDVSVANGLVDFYGKCQLVGASAKVFDSIKEANVVSWSSMVASCAQNGCEEEALRLFCRARREGVRPTEFMVSSILSGCARLAGLREGRWMHCLVFKSGLDENVYVGSALVDMYGKSGSIWDADQVFYEMPERNLITWNAMISGYSQHGYVNEALSTFEAMQEESVAPNYITLVCVLSACSHGGLVDTGLSFFNSMYEKYGIRSRAEHYACVVDLLCRAGHLERAHNMIKTMSIAPTASVWGALLGGCRVHGDVTLGAEAAAQLFALDRHDPGNHVLLYNMYAASGRWEEATVVREEMKNGGIRKGPGCSWISVKDGVHVFHVKDRSHPRTAEIYAMLAKLREQMRAAGYVPDTKFVLFDLEEEEKESQLWYHSEKLALAFGLMSTEQGIPIRITKNLRVCGDCHSVFKFVSGILQREIILRDNNRFHHFSEGRCSCRDYW